MRRLPCSATVDTSRLTILASQSTCFPACRAASTKGLCMFGHVPMTMASKVGSIITDVQSATAWCGEGCDQVAIAHGLLVTIGQDTPLTPLPTDPTCETQACGLPPLGCQIPWLQPERSRLSDYRRPQPSPRHAFVDSGCDTAWYCCRHRSRPLEWGPVLLRSSWIPVGTQIAAQMDLCTDSQSRTAKVQYKRRVMKGFLLLQLGVYVIELYVPTITPVRIPVPVGHSSIDKVPASHFTEAIVCTLVVSYYRQALEGYNPWVHTCNAFAGISNVKRRATSRQSSRQRTSTAAANGASHQGSFLRA